MPQSVSLYIGNNNKLCKTDNEKCIQIYTVKICWICESYVKIAYIFFMCAIVMLKKDV